MLGRCAALALAAVLLLAQGQLAVHQLDAEKHAPHQVCTWCLTHAQFNGALPGAAATPPPACAPVAIAPAEIPAARTCAPTAYSIRAPPARLPA